VLGGRLAQGYRQLDGVGIVGIEPRTLQLGAKRPSHLGASPGGGPETYCSQGAHRSLRYITLLSVVH